MGDTPLATVKITPGFGKTEVILDGQDVSGLLGRTTVDLTDGQLPKVYLELSPTTMPEAIECSAVVSVVKTVTEDPADAMLHFLDNIDSEELDRAILESMELGGPQTYGASCIAVFRQWASGE